MGAVNRRRFIVGSAAGTGLAGGFAWSQPPAGPSAAYSESVAFTLFTPDGGQEVMIRLARMPGRANATLWAAADLTGGRYGLAESLALAANGAATAVEADAATFETTGRWNARFERRGFSRVDMTGTARMNAMAHKRADPPEGGGDTPIAMEVRFRAGHPPVLVRPGRREVFGTAEATVILPSGEQRLSGFGKWHEQVGDRASFAPAFTYMSLVGAEAGLLAVTNARTGAYGFAFADGKTVAVRGFEIAPAGPSRAFKVELADGRVLEGAARTLRTSSVPIEGRRRPSASVIAETSMGRLAGHVNDWVPEGSAPAS